jgi:hypothetical protein
MLHDRGRALDAQPPPFGANMNTTTTETATRTPEEQAALDEFFRAIGTASREAKAIVAEARPALERLVEASYGKDNGQACIITRWLASIYNGDEAQPVQLDEIRRLDWSLQRDLVAVMRGIGNEGFPDTEIRAAYERRAGRNGADWLHYWTTGQAHRDALRRLVDFAAHHRGCSTAKAIVDFLRSIAGNGGTADLSRLGYMDDAHTRDLCTVMRGLYGRDQGQLYTDDITAALNSAQLI